MSYLKLVVNNQIKKKLEFFNKQELQIILNLYAQMVSSGKWKDYGLNISQKEISFNVYKKSAEFPIYKISKNLKPKNKDEKYFVRDANGKLLKASNSLENLIKNIKWKKLKLVN